jgi:hypothetical protein
MKKCSQDRLYQVVPWSKRAGGAMKRIRERNRIAIFLILAVLAFGSPQFSAYGQAREVSSPDILALVEVKGRIQSIGLPVYASLRDIAGNDYVLVISPVKQIADTGLSYHVLDDPASPGEYYLALERRKGARKTAAGFLTILHDDGRQLLVKGGPEASEKLSEAGFDIKALPAKPMILRSPSNIISTPDISEELQASPGQAPESAYDPRIAIMIDQVWESLLYQETGNLSGVNTVVIGGSPYIITTRHTASGDPVQKAAEYVYERMETLGFAVSYQDWSKNSYSNRNIIGAKTGKTRPSEIVLITAHLDDMPKSGLAPGADDNASGSAALLMAAYTMSSCDFERTLRLVFFTGEEQRLLGSEPYADMAYQAGENIVAVYNMDMISWDTVGSDPVLRLHTRTSISPGYDADMAIANTFSDVVATYGLSSVLSPVITSDGEWASDHSSFWDKGYAAILAIEDDYDDFNPYYHTVNDTLERLNMTYFTNFTKASIGAAALLALPIDPMPPSNLTGSASSSRVIVLRWTDNSSDETGFKIERKAGLGGTYSEIASIGANMPFYIDMGLGDDTTYYYKVRAYNAFGYSAYSNETNATTLSAADDNSGICFIATATQGKIK